MDVHPRQIGRPVTHGAIDLGAGEWPRLRPLGLIPSMTQDESVRPSGMVPEPVERIGQAGGRRQVHPVGSQSRLRKMGVRIDEGRRH